VTSTSSSHAIPRLQLALTGILFSTGGAAIKACSLDGWQIAGFRSGLAALTLLILIPAARTAWCKLTLPVGLVYAATLVTFVVANKHTTAANAIFLQSSAPVYIVLLGPWLIGERVRVSDLAFLGLVGVGLWLLLAGDTKAFESAPNPDFGNLLGLLAGLLWALTLMGLRRLGTEKPGAPIAAAAAGNIIAFVGCLPLALPLVGGVSSTTDWLLLSYLGIVQIGIAYVFMGLAVRRVPAFEVSLLLMLEPALSPFWAWWFHGEEPGLLPVAGGAVIVLAGFAKAWWALRKTAGRTAVPEQ
jgi:drug/metabolite transporter (DMT)-like permease